MGKLGRKRGRVGEEERALDFHVSLGFHVHVVAKYTIYYALPSVLRTRHTADYR